MSRMLTEAVDRIDSALQDQRLLSPSELAEIRDLIEAGQDSMSDEIDSLRDDLDI